VCILRYKFHAVCATGLAVGYPDPDFAANKLHVRREAIEKNVVFLDS
jgi:hypothetical protein